MIERDDLVALDRGDPLAELRDRFVLPDRVIYLDGNSLGALPKATPARLSRVVSDEWGESLIRAWAEHDWISMPLRIGEKIGRVIGAAPQSTVVADSTSVNLFKLLSAALTLQSERQVILTEAGNFPTDLYIAHGLTTLLGRSHALRVVDDPVASLGPEVAVLMLTHVNYRTGAMHDIGAVTRAAHALGALVLWDLSHSVGAVPLQLADDDVDFAVGCGYKYLNGGPGAPAFLSVAPRLQAALRMPLTGWLGHAEPFAFDPDYRPAEGIAQAIVGTPPVLSLAALEVGVDLLTEVPMAALRDKSLRLTGLVMDLIAQECAGCGFELLTPREPERRGSQVSFAHPDSYPIMQALIARGVIGDFRAPDVLRLGLAPLYLRFVDIWDAVALLRVVIRSGEWREERFAVRRSVT
jgi:kynureninase